MFFVGIDKSRLRQRRRTPPATEWVKCSTETASSWGWRGSSPVTKRRISPPFRPYYEPSCTVPTLLTSLRVVRTKKTCRWPSIRYRWKKRSRHRHRPFLWFRLYPYWLLVIGLLGSGRRGNYGLGSVCFVIFGACRVHVKLVDKNKGWWRGFFVFSLHCKCQIWVLFFYLFYSLPIRFLMTNFSLGLSIKPESKKLAVLKSSLYFEKLRE